MPGGVDFRTWAALARAPQTFTVVAEDDGAKTPVDVEEEAPRAPGRAPSLLDAPLEVKLLVGAAAVGIGYFAGRMWARRRKPPAMPKNKLIPLSEIPAWAMT